MTDRKISQLDAAAPLTGDEAVPMVQAGATVRATVDDIASFAAAGIQVGKVSVLKATFDLASGAVIIPMSPGWFICAAALVLTAGFDGDGARVRVGVPSSLGHFFDVSGADLLTEGVKFSVGQCAIVLGEATAEHPTDIIVTVDPGTDGATGAGFVVLEVAVFDP